MIKKIHVVKYRKLQDMVGSDRLRDVITQVTVLDRSI